MTIENAQSAREICDGLRFKILYLENQCEVSNAALDQMRIDVEKLDLLFAIEIRDLKANKG